MATVTGLTAARMLEIEAASVVSGVVDVTGKLILTTHGGVEIDAGHVVGPQGEQGLQAYTFSQAMPLVTWVITHPLPFQPAVTIVDSSGLEVIGDVEYSNANTITVTFSAGFSGTAYLS